MIPDLTPEQKQQVKRQYLKENPHPGMLGLDDITAFGGTLMEMGHISSPSWERRVELTNQYEETGVVEPEFQEMLDSTNFSDALFRELFPHGRGPRAERSMARTA